MVISKSAFFNDDKYLNNELYFPEKQIDLKTVDLKKLKVRDLKKILNDWDEICDGCLEKGDFIKRIEQLKPKYIREELWIATAAAIITYNPSDNFHKLWSSLKRPLARRDNF